MPLLLLGAATSLVILPAALFHAVDTDVLPPIAAILLTFGGAKPAAFASMITRLALGK